MGKRQHKHLLGQLPEEPVELSEREIAIRAAVDERMDRSMRDLALEYQGLEEEDMFADLESKSRSIKYAAIERRILRELERIEELSGQDAWRGEGSTFTPKYPIYAHVTDRAALNAWLLSTKRDDMRVLGEGKLKEIVHEALDTDAAALLTPAQRERLQAGEPASGQPPPGVAVFQARGIKHTRQRRSKA